MKFFSKLLRKRRKLRIFPMSIPVKTVDQKAIHLEVNDQILPVNLQVITA